MSDHENESPSKSQDKVTIVFVNASTDAETRMALKKTVSFGDVFDKYAKHYKLNKKALRFHFDEVRVNDKHTPKMLEMVDGDIIQVYSQQDGGSNMF